VFYSSMQLQDSTLVFIMEEQYIGAVHATTGKVLWHTYISGGPILSVRTDAASAFGLLSGSDQQLLTLETPNPPSGGLLGTEFTQKS